MERGPDANLMDRLRSMTNDTVPLLPLLIGALFAALALFAAARIARARRRAKRRVVEKPNSHYTSQLAQHTETRHRWHEIDLDRVHEINRDEVVRLVAKADVSGVDSLRPAERAFLDQIAKVAPPRTPPRRRDEGGPAVTPDLRERPA